VNGHEVTERWLMWVAKWKKRDGKEEKKRRKEGTPIK
jgi:hypothetical protein